MDKFRIHSNYFANPILITTLFHWSFVFLQEVFIYDMNNIKCILAFLAMSTFYEWSHGMCSVVIGLKMVY